MNSDDSDSEHEEAEWVERKIADVGSSPSEESSFPHPSHTPSHSEDLSSSPPTHHEEDDHAAQQKTDEEMKGEEPKEGQES